MNIKVRFKNPVFWASVILSVLTPILAYMGLELKDLTTWQMLGEILMQAISNPYVIMLVVVNIYNTLIDPTTTGITDSYRALTYTEPNKVK